MINENGETVQVIVQPEDGQFVVAGGQEGVAGVAAAAGGAGEQAAIMVGPDGSIVNTNNQVISAIGSQVPRNKHIVLFKKWHLIKFFLIFEQNSWIFQLKTQQTGSCHMNIKTQFIF